LNRNLIKKGKIAVTLIALLLMATFIASLLPQAIATLTPTIATITPNSGPVGTTVRVNGTIETTNGSYQILWDGESVKNGTTVGIAVNDTFIVPVSTEGDHNVTLYDVANKTESLPQTFTVYKFSCQILTVNLANETLADILVEIYNATENHLDSKLTNATGWAVFPLDPGNYSFKAFWKDVEVGALGDKVIDENETLTLKCQLTNVEVVVKDEAGAPLPLINVTIMYNRTTRDNATFPETTSFETNNTGTTKLTNMFTNVDYTLETRRYGFVFNTTFIEELPAQQYNLTITCPTYTMSVKVLDSKGGPLSNVQVNLMEWSSWNSADSGTTDNQGNVSFSATFGRYKVKVYDDNAVLGHEVVLNETLFDLIEDELSIVVHCKIFNIDLSVKTLDYFGQSVPNTIVEIERKFGQEWIKIGNSTTSLDGLASLNSIIGGDYRVSIYLGEKLAGINQLYLGESKQILFKIDGYAVIGGYPVEIIQLITYISIVLLVVVFSLALTYRRLLRRFLKKKSESEE